jgi:hypothetical protein
VGSQEIMGDSRRSELRIRHDADDAFHISRDINLQLLALGLTVAAKA